MRAKLHNCDGIGEVRALIKELFDNDRRALLALDLTLVSVAIVPNLTMDRYNDILAENLDRVLTPSLTIDRFFIIINDCRIEHRLHC